MNAKEKKVFIEENDDCEFIFITWNDAPRTKTNDYCFKLKEKIPQIEFYLKNGKWAIIKVPNEYGIGLNYSINDLIKASRDCGAKGAVIERFIIDGAKKKILNTYEIN